MTHTPDSSPFAAIAKYKAIKAVYDAQPVARSAKPQRTCAELGVCQNRTPPCGDDCLPILHQHNSDGTSPHEETRDLIELALDALLAFALVGALIFTIFAAIGFWSAR